MWVNRIIKLCNVFYGVFLCDFFREFGYGMLKDDWKFLFFLKVVRWIYGMNFLIIEVLFRFLYFEMEFGFEFFKLFCKDGFCEEIIFIGDVENFEVVSLGDVGFYYCFKNKKYLDVFWGRFMMGELVEIIVFLKEKKKGFRLVKEVF